MTTSLAYVKRLSSRLLMTQPIAYITCFNRQGRGVIIFGAKGVLRFPNVRPSVSKIVFVYILTALSFFIFIGCYYLFRTLSLSFYYTHYCKILLFIFLFYFILFATLITKNIGKEEEKEKKKRSGEET